MSGTAFAALCGHLRLSCKRALTADKYSNNLAGPNLRAEVVKCMVRRGMARNRNSLAILSFEQLEVRRLMAFDPTADEQELMQLTNRFRTDPRNEFGRWFQSANPIKARDPLVDSTVQFFKVNGTVLQQEWQALSPLPPVAWSEPIYNAALLHNNLMRDANTQSHQLPGEARLRDRLQAAGFTGGRISENVYSYSRSVPFTIAAYVIDWGDGADGMQAGRGHRVNFVRPEFNRIGQVLTTGPGTGDGVNVGPFINTQNFGEAFNAVPMVVGALFQDKNNSQWYEAGEGIGGAQIKFEGSPGTFSTTAMSAGGYQIELPAGNYRVTASGGALRFPVVIPNVQVADSNVWLNLVYDPTVIPPDRLEPNDSSAQATSLNAVSQTVEELSIHTPNDADYFKIVPNSNGPLEVRMTHSNAAGNLNVFIQNSDGSIAASATTTADQEIVVANVLRAETYYVLVQPSSGASNPSYRLEISVPAPKSPVAASDFAGMEMNSGPLDISVLANDLDADGQLASAQVTLVGSGVGTFQVNDNKTVRYAPSTGYSGIDRISYRITDDQGLSSVTAAIQVFVIDFTRDRPFLNSSVASDTNGDGFISAIDVLLIINEINSRSARALPTKFADSPNLFGFVDTNGDGFLSAIDALLTINLLNSRTTSSAAGESARDAANILAVDQALLAQDLDFWLPESFTKRRKR